MNFPKSCWKPVQTGVKLSTTSMICLVQELLSSPDIKYISTARFTQDALENLFSQIRGKAFPIHNPFSFSSTTLGVPWSFHDDTKLF